MGATAVLNPRTEDVATRIKSLSPRGMNIVFVDVPSLDAIVQAMTSVRRGGTIVLFAGMPPEESSLMIDVIHYGDLKLIGSFGFDPLSYIEAHKLLEEGRIDIKPLITHRLNLEILSS